MTTAPYFSVIVPTHKRAGLLRRALVSIQSQQVNAAFEVIVVSDVIDSDTDAICAELLKSCDVYPRRNGPAGPSRSRNHALSLARGRYVLFLDDDDAWHSGFLQQLHTAAQVQQGRLVYANCSVITERRLPGGPEQLSEIGLNMAGCLTDEVYVKNQVHMSCFAYPRMLLDGLEFDTTMRAYEDWEFMLATFDREMPEHLPILGSRIYEVHDDTTDRRGSSAMATNFNAVLDYLYVYRRHPAPRVELIRLREELLKLVGLPIPSDMV